MADPRGTIAHSPERTRGDKRPGFLLAGATLLLIGVIVLAWLWMPQGPPKDADDLHPGLSGQDMQPSRMWALAGGLSAAAGLGLIGIGMNRWTGN